MIRFRLSVFLMLSVLARVCAGAQSVPHEPSGVVELAQNWKLISASDEPESGAVISQPSYLTDHWHSIASMPATVLEILEEDGVYPNLYYGMNLLSEVPQDLYKQDWWYRTSFDVPAGQHTYWLDFPGINYRAEVWLNGKRLADSTQVVGMYVAHEFNVTDVIHPGKANTLAVKVTPERAIPDVTGVELADSWHDWLDWTYLGSKAPQNEHYKEGWVADRNAGIWKPVFLHFTGPVKLSNASVTTDLPLPATNPASLNVYATVTNSSTLPVNGILKGTISRPGKATIHIEEHISLEAGETRDLSLSPGKFSQLIVHDPDLWWPYTMGQPDLYDLRLQVEVSGQISDTKAIQFGIRKITQHRDQDERFYEGGNFYFQVNGKNFLARGADYTPDLLFRYNREREADTIRYVKDLGLNMLRWEAKISSEHMIELADKAGIPVMLGWMCCSKWEQWEQWSTEDQRVARESLRSQILMLRSHAAVFLWSNGSDGLPPEPLRSDYRHILSGLHWQNAVVDTDSNDKRDTPDDKTWDGIWMNGVDRWHPPSFWFSERYPTASGSTAEYGDNEIIPPYESLAKFIPANKLWPINEYWYFHGGATNHLETIQTVVNRRYGPSQSAEEFARKAQLAHYENVRAQFEDWAANGWASHKMSVYWMLNNHWPSFFGHLYDYYMKPGGAYYGAKKGLRPLSVVFDYYATGSRREAKVRVVNQTMSDKHNLGVRVRIYDLYGKVRYDREVHNINVPAQDSALALTMPRIEDITSTYFVRCQLLTGSRSVMMENVYWQSTTDDDFGDPANEDDGVPYSQASWANITALNTMPQVPLTIRGVMRPMQGRNTFLITLHNASQHVAFFERATVTQKVDGDEALPILYSDNYVTVFPGETVYIEGSVKGAEFSASKPWLHVQGYNTADEWLPFQ
jgi:exo-1,4-beta-D-glucosaminidase